MYKKILCTLAVLLMGLPLVGTLLGADIPARTLEGVAEEERPALSLSTLWDGSFQKQFDAWYAAEFAGHDFLVRLYNQLRLAVFGQSSESVQVGGDGQLYEAPYLEEALGTTVEWQMTDAEVAALAEGLAQLAELCRSRGKAFAVVLSPSKVSFTKQDVPWAWQHAVHYYTEEQRPYYRVRQALADAGVPFVDGRALLEGGRDYPVFPQTGIHWTHAAAVEVVQNLCAVLEAQGVTLPVPRAENITLSDTMFNLTDVDLSLLQNNFQQLERGWYVHYTLTKEETAETVQPNILLQGDSFTNTLYEVMCAANMGEVSLMFYQNRLWDGGESQPISTANLDDAEMIRTLITECDVLILQSNEQLLCAMGQDSNHTGTPFYQICIDALSGESGGEGGGA